MRPLRQTLAQLAAMPAFLGEMAAEFTPETARRPGTGGSVGPVTLGDIPAMMLAHDASHREEIRGLLGEAVHGAGDLAGR